jgi:hypothetical protein
VSRPSSSPKRKARGAAFFIAALAFAAGLAGCGPKYSYPGSTVPKAVEEICQKENQLFVEARVVGKTVGALLYTDDLIDAKGQVPKEVHEKMGKVMQAVTRVALSTDVPLDFCKVILRDTKSDNELAITRSLDDIKRANADAIGIEESINRTLFGQGKYKRLEPMQIGVRPAFVLEDVRMESFLVEQIVQRIRFNFSKDAKDEFVNAFALVDGNYGVYDGKRTMRFSVIGLKSSDDPHATVLNVLKAVNTVLSGYHFNDFDTIEIQDYLNRLKLVLDRQTLNDYQDKKINEAQILERFLTESQSIQEAFKLFGFNLPQE